MYILSYVQKSNITSLGLLYQTAKNLWIFTVFCKAACSCVKMRQMCVIMTRQEGHIILRKSGLCFVSHTAVTVHGKRENPDLNENEAYIRRERETGPFSRTFTLPFKVDADNVTAEYHRGILEVRMPRSAEDKPKKISVKAS